MLAPALLRVALALAVLLVAVLAVLLVAVLPVLRVAVLRLTVLAVLRVAVLGLAERVAGAAVVLLAFEDATAERVTVGWLLRTSLDFI